MTRRQKGKGNKRRRGWHRGRGEYRRWERLAKLIPTGNHDGAPTPIRHTGRGDRGDAVRWTYSGSDVPAELNGKRCEPILDERGKCVVGRLAALVRFENGAVWLVTKQRLRRVDDGAEAIA